MLLFLVLLSLFSHIKRFQNTSAHLSMKIFSMDTNLVHTFFGNHFFDLTMARTLKNDNILVHTKLGYLRYYL